MREHNLNDVDYMRRREAQERAAAKRASTLDARRVHQERAKLFAEMTYGSAPSTR
ncbi:MAG TPA: hypothetical protein VGM04_01845 [Sphingomicrobium sp.]